MKRFLILFALFVSSLTVIAAPNSAISTGGGGGTGSPNTPGNTVAQVNITDRVSGGVIGTAATTVDAASYFVITQNTASQTLTLPAPVNPVGSRLVTVENSDSSLVTFQMYGQTFSVGGIGQMAWNGTVWKAASSVIAAGAQLRILVNPGGAAYTQVQLQTAYDNQPGLPAPDVVPQAVTDYANSLATSSYKAYLGANQWWYTNTATGITTASWTIFGGNKSPFGAPIAPNGLISFK